MLNQTIVAVVGCPHGGIAPTARILGAHPAAVLLAEEDGLEGWAAEWLAGAPVPAAAFERAIERASRKYFARDPRFTTDAGGVVRLADQTTHLILTTSSSSPVWSHLVPGPARLRVVYPICDPLTAVAAMRQTDVVALVSDEARSLRQDDALSRTFADELDALENVRIDPITKLAIVWRVTSALKGRFDAAGIPVFQFRCEDLQGARESYCRALAEAAGLRFADDVLTPGLTMASDGAVTDHRGEALTPAESLAALRAAGDPAIEFGYARRAAPTQPKRAIAASDVRAPLILTGRGGSGTRLLTQLAQGCGVTLGRLSSGTGDSLEWVEIIYRMALDRLAQSTERADQFRARWENAVVNHARERLGDDGWEPGTPWGWKLPETMLIAQPMCEIFDRARLVHLVRHPLSCAFRTPHLTARADNPIGAAVLRAAYRDAGCDPGDIETDAVHVHNALTWRLQVLSVMRFGRSVLGPARYLELRFEDVCRAPDLAVRTFSAFAGCPRQGSLPVADFRRRGVSSATPDEVERVWALCGSTADAFGYRVEDVVA